MNQGTILFCIILASGLFVCLCALIAWAAAAAGRRSDDAFDGEVS